MNPQDPKIARAIKEIETVYVGQQSSHGYYDKKRKVYVLIVSGEEAQAYHDAITAIHDLVSNAKRRVKRAR